jgi:hypothetical protein
MRGKLIRSSISANMERMSASGLIQPRLFCRMNDRQVLSAAMGAAQAEMFKMQRDACSLV